MSEAQKKVNAQKARVARAMEPHYKTFGVLKKPGAGQSNDLKTSRRLSRLSPPLARGGGHEPPQSGVSEQPRSRGAVEDIS